MILNMLAKGSGGGGGSGALTLIDTIAVATNTRSVDIDLTQYAAYDMIIGVFDDVEITPSSDWLYFVPNTSTPSGGQYTKSQSVFSGARFELIKSDQWTYNALLVTTSTGFSALNNASSTEALNLLIYTYTSSKFIKAGSVIKIYACNYADL